VRSTHNVNGDGLDDLIVGATHADLSGKKDAGKSYVVFGKADSSAINLSTIAASNSLGGFVINGEETNASSPLITKPPEELPVAIVLRLMALLSALPNTT
jgi:hypothetical protein